MATKKSSAKSSAKSNKKNAVDWIEVESDVYVVGDAGRFSLKIEVGGVGTFQYNGLKLVEYEDSYFIAYPSWKDKKGNWHKYAYIHAMDEELEASIIEAILK